MLKTIPIDRFGKRDLDGLCAFLEACRAEAAKDGHEKIASISLSVGHIDPLAVLESIYDDDALHFYWENPARRIAVAGAEAIQICTSSGPGRFRDVRAFGDRVLDHCIAVGELGEPFSGPHFFCAFGFFDDDEGEREGWSSDPSGTGPGFFPPARVFLPRWQVSRSRGRYTAVANVPVAPDADIGPLAERVWSAHGKFERFDYPEVNPAGGGAIDPGVIPDRVEAGGEDWFEKTVKKALTRIREGKYDKIVLSRAIDVRSSGPLNPLESLNRLRNDYASCYSFSVSNGEGQSFIGATPERLIGVDGGMLRTEALAGSAPRGRTAAEDAALARGLLESEKDRHEHQVVIDSIVRRLEAIGVREPMVARRRELLQLSNVQHLRSPITADVAKGVHILDILATLHPTPAVGGTPREAAIPDIRQLEPFSRGLFTGAVGWFDAHGCGEFAVAIRSALIDGNSARVFAGSGIVDGSDPARERAETDLKLAAILDRLA